MLQMSCWYCDGGVKFYVPYMALLSLLQHSLWIHKGCIVFQFYWFMINWKLTDLLKQTNSLVLYLPSFRNCRTWKLCKTLRLVISEESYFTFLKSYTQIHTCHNLFICCIMLEILGCCRQINFQGGCRRSLLAWKILLICKSFSSVFHISVFIIHIMVK